MPDFAPVRYGILGAANIARQFTQGLAGSPFATIAAVASRRADTAEAFARELGIPRSHGSYEALIADPDVDAIYNPLPNDLHADWTIKCLAAGKHVLCEKPLCMTGEEAHAMFAAARRHGVHLAEAYPYMSQPQTLRTRELIGEGTLGKIQLVTAAFGFSLTTADGVPLRDPGNIRLDPARGGGALRDAGTYAASFVRIAVGERPAKILATARLTQTNVDQTVAATLVFPSGALAQMTCSLSTAGHRDATVVGDAGVLETGYSNHAPADGSGLSLRLRRGTAGATPFETIPVDSGDGFRAEGDAFARMIRLGAEHWNGASEAESIDVVLMLDAIAQSARTESWATLPAQRKPIS